MKKLIRIPVVLRKIQNLSIRAFVLYFMLGAASIKIIGPVLLTLIQFLWNKIGPTAPLFLLFIGVAIYFLIKRWNELEILEDKIHILIAVFYGTGSMGTMLAILMKSGEDKSLDLFGHALVSTIVGIFLGLSLYTVLLFRRNQTELVSESPKVSADFAENFIDNSDIAYEVDNVPGDYVMQDEIIDAQIIEDGTPV
ncbi:MAG: hypothetical protein HQ568_03010 [Calditrichaeota bacterium]|nr:hypothetical protein [Calditrichota bacterium]